MSKRFLTLALTLALLIGMFAMPIGASATEKVTLRFATGALTPTSVIGSLIKEFEAENPNVTIQLEESPGNDLIFKINTDIMANNCPDVFTYWRPEKKWDFDTYISVGAVADLSELKSDPFYEGMFPDYAWATGTVDGKVYGIPRANFYTCFIVNKELFDELGLELPTDWDKLVTACQKLHEAGYVVWATDTGENLDDASRLFNAVIEATLGNARGISLMTGQESWQQPDALEALGYFMDVAKAGYAPEDSSVLTSTSVIEKYLNTGRAGMLIQNASQVWNNMPFEVMDKFAALDFPLTPTTQVDGPFNELDLTNLVYASAKGFADPVKKEYIVKFIQKLTSRDAAKRYAEEDRAIIPHLGVSPDESMVHPLQQQAAELAYAAESCKWMLSKTAADVVDEFRLAINGVYYGEFDTPEALATALDDALYGKQ